MSELRLVFVAILPLLASLGIMVLGNGLFGTLLSLRMDLEGFPVQHIGLIMASYSLGFIAGTRACPHILARVGPIRAFAAFAAIAASTALIHPLYVNQVMWAGLRVATGFCAACLFTVTESWINARATNAVRGSVLSIYMTVNYLAYAGSQVLLTTMDPTQFRLFSLIAILISLSLVPLALARIETPAPVVRVRLGVRRLFAISPLGVAGCFGSGLINGAFGSLGPIYARSTGASVAWVAQFMMVAIVSGFALQFLFGRLSDRFDRRTVFLAQLLVVACISFAIALLAGQSMAAMLSLLALYGGVAYAIYPVSLAHANDFMEPNERVAASGGLLMIYGFGSVMGPVAASQVMRFLGAAGLFLFISAVAASLAVFAYYRTMRRKPKPLDEQLAFVAMPQTTPAALGLDPRNQPAAAEPPDPAVDKVPAHG